MTTRHREEVLNTKLAELIVARGLNASPEAIRRGGKERPDVQIAFRGLRCSIEGKIADISGARGVVHGDAQRRIDSGISNISIAVVYEKRLRSTAFTKLGEEMGSASYPFCICTEMGSGEWQVGDIDEILNSLRRSHELLSSDDAVKSAADELSVGLREVANIFADDTAVCERLEVILGVGSPEN